MAKSREHFALDWIKSELLETLNDARQALEAHAEDSSDGTRLRACLTALHQVHGTLVMLELNGVTLLADHLEQVAQRLLNGQLDDDDGAVQALMQGILELPGRLDDIQQGAADQVDSVRPLVNELRGHLGLDALAGEDGAVSLHGGTPQAALDRFQGIDGIDKVRKIRAAYQQVLLSILKGEDLAGSVNMLSKVAHGMSRVVERSPHEGVWQAFGEFVSALAEHQGPVDGDAVKLLRRVDSEIRDLAASGVEALSKPVPVELVHQLLEAARQRGRDSATLAELQDALTPAQTGDGLAISGREALASAATALREELSLVKDRLDLFVRAESSSTAELGAIAGPLKQIGSTLSLLGFDSSKTIVADQVDVLNGLIEAGQVDLQVLMTVAGSLLQVDENLASFSHGGRNEAEVITDDAQRAVVAEARAGLDEVKQAIVEFISSQWDAQHLEAAPDRLRSICGALNMLPLPRVCGLLEHCGQHISERLIGGPEPSWEQMDHLADAISGVDYYLERLSQHSSIGTDDILELVDRSLERLDAIVPPAPDDQAAEVRAGTETPVPLPAHDAEPEEAGTPVDVELAPEPVPGQQDTAGAAGAEVIPLTGDTEIVDPADIEEEPEPELEMDDEGGFDLTDDDTFAALSGDDGDFELEFEAQPGAEDTATPPEESAEPVESPPAEPVHASETAAAGSDEAPTDSVTADSVTADGPDAAPAPVDPALAARVASLQDAFESDDDIVEIFVEEVTEVLEAIDDNLPQWQADLSADSALSEVRRAFHTLKGSGRIVGANVLGEMAWSVENMLNRLIDGTLAATPQFLQVVREARDLIPALRDAFEIKQAPDMEPVARLMERADVLSSGGELDDAAPSVAGETADAADADEEPLKLFLGEAEQHLAVLREQLRPEQASLTPESMRALHTLAGSAAMAGITVVSDFARPAYELAQAMQPAGERLRLDGELAGFFVAYVEALEDTLKALREGREAEDQLQLIADADHLAQQVEQNAASEDPLLTLPALSALMALDEYLNEWRDGAMNLGFAEELEAGLATVADAARASQRDGIAELADAFAAAHSALADGPLVAADHAQLHDAHEALLRSIDALAAGQAPVAETATVEALLAIVEREAAAAAALAEEPEPDTPIELETPLDGSGLRSLFDETSDDETADDLASPEASSVDQSATDDLSLEEVSADELYADEASVDEASVDEASVEQASEDLGSGDEWSQAPSPAEPPLPELEETTPEEDAPAAFDDQLEAVDMAGTVEWTDDTPSPPTPPTEDDFDIDELLADEDHSDTPLPVGLHDAAGSGSDRGAEPAGGTAAEPEADAVGTDLEAVPDAADAPAAAELETLPVAGPAETQPAPADADLAADLLPEEIDEEIIEVFFEEAEEILESLDESLHQWRSEPQNLLHLEHMLRGLHTLKGGARLSGLTLLGDRTHQYESFLIDMQTAGTAVDAESLAPVQQRFDELSQLVGQIRQALDGDVPVAAPTPSAPPPAPQPAELRAVPDAPAAGDRPQPVPPATPVPAGEPAAGRQEPSAPRPESPGRRQDTADDKPAERAGQEMVRVGSGLLEELVNLAGESSIVRARIEQGISDFTGSLDEMETTIERVREQLRRLEIETEAQILFRQDRPDGPSYEDFDPLEMDRYSQLQQLSRALSESASDMLDLKDTLLFKARESETLLLQQARINTELQEGLMRTRMVPFNRLLPRLRRIVRQVASELGKEVELHAYNVDGELDRSLLERMVPPLEHMLRNAVDHGIESQDARVSFGKPAAGRIDLRLSREGGDIVIEISDDGAGIDTESVREKAIERGLMAPDAALSDDEIGQFVLAPGFSTAKSVTQISGRGVGMDVVHSEVKQLGGSIGIQSRPGKGTRIALRVPFTVSVNRALMVNVGEDLYAIPLNTIEGIVLLGADELERLYAPEGPAFEYAGVPYRVRYLGHYLGRDFRAAAQQGQAIPVVLVRSGDHAVAVHVDGVQGSREIVVKSLGPQFAGVGGISGATILGDGSVVVILDLLAMIRAQAGHAGAQQRRGLTSAAQTRCVMVVDDSVTVRKVTSRLLERQGMDVLTAKDGIEAVAMLQERKPDVMLLDIEMPRMDGFEVARQVRHDERLKSLPIIMISSRTGEKHQERALELGVNRFLGKPFQESELLATIDEIAS